MKTKSPFIILQRKEIYEFLEGSGKPDLVTFKGKKYGMPYHTANELNDICRGFGVTDALGGSRWTYVETLLQYAIDNNRCDELLSYLFALERFDNLQEIHDIEDIQKVHQQIIVAALEEINRIIRLTRKELIIANGHFAITNMGERPMIITPNVDSLSIAYITGLKERCEADLIAGNYDSVITKARTMIEEVLIHILEENDIEPSESGRIGDLYNQVKVLRNMRQNSEFDKRVNELLGGLEKIVRSIGDMRNLNSDAHGVGRGRIMIREKEARLVINSAISFCEYLL